MSFSKENGYIPLSFDEIMDLIRLGINEQFETSYTEETFVGTGWYKFSYPLVQMVQKGEVKTSEIFLKLQEYITFTNKAIQRPSVSINGIIDSFADLDYNVSVKRPSLADVGKIYICADLVSPTSAQKIDIATRIKDFVAGGILTVGTESQSITLSNGQSFDFKFNLPNRKQVLLKATFKKSKNYSAFIPTDITLRELIFDNINAKYKLGWDFEPERYISVTDAVWASDVTLEWTDNSGEDWYSTVYSAEYDDLFEFGLDDIQVVIV